ncbi:MAG: phosphoribosylaminoimidazolesuccinocarboxamide synthase [Calditrichaeota bacterium]|nr:phosphoribosylaminoimidazolesuccinocarboxamide synthase [Calditrichota bacterium]MCB0268828.1 phosphoribosylaminoimidazolesuccinocarboxamide synthase [Calditrichota bacterium]
MANVVLKTDIPGAKLLNRGKVRDIYDAGDALLFVTTDRISAFDVIMTQGIPMKGIVLTQLSKFWFSQTGDIVANHFITDNITEYPAPFNQHGELLRGRSMLVKKTQPLPVECVVRGYLAGSGWKEYREFQTLHETPLPAGLLNGSQLPQPLFTPATKAESGHDENISFERMLTIVDQQTAEAVRDYSLQLYAHGAKTAAKKGIILADTKFEFGILDGEIILIDEVMTPDSSRFWPKEFYAPGKSQQSFDKQYLRDYLETLDWDKTPPPPPLPDEIIENTSKKYLEIARIFGIDLKG